MEIPVPLGDVLDKITILRIKSRKIRSEHKLRHVRRELEALESRWRSRGFPALSEEAELEAVNEALWDVEDALRRHEAAGDFGADFIERARSVYKLNDRRAALKRSINEALGSALIEEKDYVSY